MKRSHFKLSQVIALLALFAMGNTGLLGQNIAGLTEQETAKRWAVSFSSGLFYDDNNLNTSTNQLEGWGLEVHPQIGFNLPLERTLLKLSYDLRLNYYDSRAENPTDYEHQFEGKINHRLTERSTLNVIETFISASQPEVHGAPQTTFQQGDRGDTSHWRNYFRSDYSWRVAPTYGFAGGYNNYVYNYEQEQSESERLLGIASLSGLLDRVQNQFHMEGQLFPNAQSRTYLGYQINAVNYISSDIIGYVNQDPFATPIPASYRNAISHYAYIGGDKKFNPRLSGSLSVGATMTDYYNQDFVDWAPFLDMSATYTYAEGSNFRAQAKVDRNATDSGVGTNSVTRDQLSAILDLSARHHFAARLDGTVNFYYQHSVYNGGDFDGQADDSFFFVPGVEYMILRNFYLTLNYTRLQLFSPRPDLSFARNRVMLGVRFTY